MFGRFQHFLKAPNPSNHPSTLFILCYLKSMFKCSKKSKNSTLLHFTTKKNYFPLSPRKIIQDISKTVFHQKLSTVRVFHFQTYFIELDKIIDKFQSTKTFILLQMVDWTSSLFWKIIFLFCHIFLSIDGLMYRFFQKLSCVRWIKKTVSDDGDE